MYTSDHVWSGAFDLSPSLMTSTSFACLLCDGIRLVFFVNLERVRVEANHRDWQRIAALDQGHDDVLCTRDLPLTTIVLVLVFVYLDHNHRVLVIEDEVAARAQRLSLCALSSIGAYATFLAFRLLCLYTCRENNIRA